MKTEFQLKGFQWISIIKPDEKDAAFLRDSFGILPVHIEDALVPSQRSRLHHGPSYLFLLLLFPSYDRDRKMIRPFEMDVFLTKDAIITVQERGGPVITDLAKRAEGGRVNGSFPDGPASFLVMLLDKLFVGTLPMIDHISLEVHEIEKHLFLGNERKLLEELLTIRRNIAVFRKSIQAHKFIIRKAMNTLGSPQSFLTITATAPYDNLVEHTKEVWDALNVLKEEVETLEETNESLISYRLNEIMKKYTTISVMIFAMTLVAALLTLDVDGTPFVEFRNAFWYILLLESGVAALLLIIFKRRRLL